MLKEMLKYPVRVATRFAPAFVRRELRRLERHAPALRNRIEAAIREAVAVSNRGDNERAEALLIKAAALDPGYYDIVAHLGRVRFLRERKLDPAARERDVEMLAAVASMNRELTSERNIYGAASFWETYGKFHVQLLERYGVENLKRTLSHHYQNWCMVSNEDPQVRRLHQTWLSNFDLEPWRNAIEAPTHVGVHESLGFDDPRYPLADPEKREVYRVAVGLLWEHVLRTDGFGVLSRLSESEIGNPVRIWRHGSLISSDLAHSVRERNLLLEAVGNDGGEPLLVGELGGGHGRLAEVFGRTTNHRYFIFDIAPALYVSQWYVKAIFPNEKVFQFRHFDSFDEIRRELDGCRFAFFTANQIEKIPSDYLDVFINLNSLQEMRIDQIQNFLAQIDRVTSKAFLSRQWSEKMDHLNNVRVTKDLFRMSARWRLVLDRVDDISPESFNQIWLR